MGSIFSSQSLQLFRKDLISAMKLPDTEQLLPEEYVTIGDPWRQEWERGVQVPVHEDVLHIPIARYNFCDGLFTSAVKEPILIKRTKKKLKMVF